MQRTRNGRDEALPAAAVAARAPTRKPEVQEDEHPARKSEVARRAAVEGGII